MANEPTTVTTYGRLSYPVFGYQEAVARNAKSQYATADPTTVTPEFNLLLEQAQFDKVKEFVINEFLPYCLAQSKAGEKRNALGDTEIKRILKFIEAEDWDAAPPYTPFKAVPEKTAALMPSAVVMLKVKGNRGVNIDQRAIVRSEEDLLTPDPDQLIYPVVKPIGFTTKELYAGCWTGATLNLYAFISGKAGGFSASAGVAVFRGDADRFGGGIAVDESEIFND